MGTSLGSRPERQAVIVHLERSRTKTFFYEAQLGAAEVMPSGLQVDATHFSS